MRDFALESNEPIESPISLPIGTKCNFICKRTNYRSISQINIIDSPKIFDSPTGTCGDKISDTERMKSLEGSVKIKQETSGHLKVLAFMLLTAWNPYHFIKLDDQLKQSIVHSVQ